MEDIQYFKSTITQNYFHRTNMGDFSQFSEHDQTRYENSYAIKSSSLIPQMTHLTRQDSHHRTRNIA